MSAASMLFFWPQLDCVCDFLHVLSPLNTTDLHRPRSLIISSHFPTTMDSSVRSLFVGFVVVVVVVVVALGEGGGGTDLGSAAWDSPTTISMFFPLKRASSDYQCLPLSSLTPFCPDSATLDTFSIWTLPQNYQADLLQSSIPPVCLVFLLVPCVYRPAKLYGGLLESKRNTVVHISMFPLLWRSTTTSHSTNIVNVEN